MPRKPKREPLRFHVIYTRLEDGGWSGDIPALDEFKVVGSSHNDVEYELRFALMMSNDLFDDPGWVADTAIFDEDERWPPDEWYARRRHERRLAARQDRLRHDAAERKAARKKVRPTTT